MGCARCGVSGDREVQRSSPATCLGLYRKEHGGAERSAHNSCWDGLPDGKKVTKDLNPRNYVGTTEMTDAIIEHMANKN